MMTDDALASDDRSRGSGGRFHDSGGRSRQADDLLNEIASCLARVRDHVYGANVGRLVVEAGCDLFDLGAGCEARPQVLRPVPRVFDPEAQTRRASDGPGGVT